MPATANAPAMRLKRPARSQVTTVTSDWPEPGSSCHSTIGRSDSSGSAADTEAIRRWIMRR